MAGRLHEIKGWEKPSSRPHADYFLRSADIRQSRQFQLIQANVIGCAANEAVFFAIFRAEWKQVIYVADG